MRVIPLPEGLERTLGIHVPPEQKHASRQGEEQQQPSSEGSMSAADGGPFHDAATRMALSRELARFIALKAYAGDTHGSLLSADPGACCGSLVPRRGCDNVRSTLIHLLSAVQR